MDFIAKRDEEVIILDLKSDQRFLPYEYSLQLALYIMAARQLFQKKKVRAGLMYLHFGEIAWLEAEPEEKTILRICDSISFDKHNN